MTTIPEHIYFRIPQRASNEIKTKAFIQLAHKVHNNKYSYDKTFFAHSQKYVIVTCKEHGDFEVKPNTHLSEKSGCPKCGRIKKSKTFYDMRDNCRLTIFDRAKEIYGEKYDFSKYVYTNVNTKSIVICPDHGEFLQSMNKLIYRGQGCPECAKLKTISSFESIFRDILTKKEIEFNAQYRFDYKILPNQKFSYDFFIPKLNLLVELNGQQHYVKKFYMTDDDLLDRKRKDWKKVEEAIESGYNMLVIGKGYFGIDMISKIITYTVQRLSKSSNLINTESRVHCKPTVVETIGPSEIIIFDNYYNEGEDIV